MPNETSNETVQRTRAASNVDRAASLLIRVAEARRFANSWEVPPNTPSNSPLRSLRQRYQRVRVQAATAFHPSGGRMVDAAGFELRLGLAVNGQVVVALAHFP